MPPRGGGSDRPRCGNGSVPRWVTSLSFQLESSTHRTLRVEAAHTGPASRLNPPDGGASPLGGQFFFLFCILMRAETHLRQWAWLLAMVVSTTPGGVNDLFSSRFHYLPRIGWCLRLFLRFWGDTVLQCRQLAAASCMFWPQGNFGRWQHRVSTATLSLAFRMQR